MKFKGVPLFYSPYLDFSIDGSRKSGIMPPDVGHTSGGGVEIAIPSYFNLAPNYDLLFNPKYIEKEDHSLEADLDIFHRFIFPVFI